MKQLRNVSTVLIPLLFIYAGCMHFVSPKPFLKIMPTILPFKRALVGLSGLIEIGAGLAYLFHQTRRTARNILVLLLIAVFPANINMALQNIDFGFIPTWALWVRLLFQPLLVWWVWVTAIEEKPLSKH